MRETTAAQIPLCPNLQQGQVRAAARAWESGGGGGLGGGDGGGGIPLGGGGGVVAPDPRACMADGTSKLSDKVLQKRSSSYAVQCS